MDKPTEKQLAYLEDLRNYFDIDTEPPKTKQEASKEIDKLVFRLKVSGRTEDFKIKTFGVSDFEYYMDNEHGWF